nr:deSI-like protein At4g17486 [Ipomoea batatas]
MQFTTSTGKVYKEYRLHASKKTRGIYRAAICESLSGEREGEDVVQNDSIEPEKEDGGGAGVPELHGVEYGFGAHEHSTTGIFEVKPKQCPGFTFRKSILIGRTDLGPKEVRAFMEKLAEEYSGNSYNLITKNCNHFCNDVCSRLTGKPIPRWVNRLARLAGLNETKVRHVKAEDRLSDKKKLRSHSSRFVNSSNTNIMPPRPTRSATSNRRHRSRNSPSMSLIRSASTSPSTMRV